MPYKDREAQRAAQRRSYERHKQTIKPLRGVIDAYKCLGCGASVAVNADSQTFRQPPPLECRACPGQPDMQAGRYYAVGTASGAVAASPTHPEEQR